MYGALDISTSGLVAQRLRLDIISSNVANRRTILDADGSYDPYRRRFAVFGAGDGQGKPGVHIQSIEIDNADLIARLEPASPYADEDGYVYYPNIDPVREQVDAMEAQRAYEANISVAEATKSMMSVALQLIA